MHGLVTLAGEELSRVEGGSSLADLGLLLELLRGVPVVLNAVLAALG